MRLRTAILLGVLVVLAGSLVATVLALSSRLGARVRGQVAEELARSQQVFDDLQGYRQSLFRAEIRVVAEEPRLKAVAATEQITHATVLGVVQELRKALACELFLVTDGAGRLLADTNDPAAEAFDMAGLPLVAEALRSPAGEAEGVWTDDAGAYQVQARRLAFGTTVVGVLVIGHRLDDRVAETVRRQTGSATFVLLDGKPIAASRVEGAAPPDPTRLGGGLEEVENADGDAFLARAAPFPGYHGERALRAVLLRSLEPARALQRDLTRTVWMVGAVALLAALGFAVVFARAVARPVDALVGLTRQVGAGQLAGRAGPSGVTELDALGTAMNTMIAELERSRAELSHKERLEKELEIANRIQTSILPRQLSAPRLSVAAVMRPASEVGGDYYDFLPTDDGAWIGIGDVAGHGLTAGLVMLMVQGVVAALTKVPGATPASVAVRLNEVLHDNIRDRLRNDEHVTFTLLRVSGDGRVRFAGAHEELLLWRRRTGLCEAVETPGTWLGAVPDISRFTVENELQLEPGDVLVLYTDGITEAMDARGQLFGVDRLMDALAEAHDRPVAALRDHLLEAALAHCPQPQDDVTLLVLRYEAA
jgi:sigma-B regulation protein RsbU (phosphoserine phosphatase)